ncbi:MAG: hypothetical protein AB7O37_21370 [Vicinamibacteria bacterium]
MKASKLALLLLILGVGGSIETAWSVKHRVGFLPMGCRVLTGRFQGPSYSFESSETHEAQGVRALRVENAFGQVLVRAGEPGTLALGLRKVVYRPTEAQARAFAERIRAGVTIEGETLKVVVNRREVENLEEGRDVGFETHLELQVPPGLEVKVQNEHGRVEVADALAAAVWTSYEPVRLERIGGNASVDSRHGDVRVLGAKGDVEVTARYGTVELKDVAGRASVSSEHGDVGVARTGPLQATLRYGDLDAEDVGSLEVDGQQSAVHAREVKGNARVETSYRDVTLTRVGGDARVRSEHGSVSASEIAGSLEARASYDRIEARGVSGAVVAEIEHGGFSGRDLARGARVKASGEDVLLEGFEGPVSIEVERGGATLAPLVALGDSIDVRASFGGIRLELPAGSRLELDATAEHGSIDAKLEGLTISEASEHRLRARLGQGGPRVTLATQSADVELVAGGTPRPSARTRRTAPTLPAAPEAPSVPSAPGAPKAPASPSER